MSQGTTPPPEAEPAVRVLSSVPRGQFSRQHQARPFTVDARVSSESSSGKHLLSNSPLSANPDSHSSDEALALVPPASPSKHQHSSVDFLTALPSEVSLYVLLLTDDARDVVRGQRVSRAWRALCSDSQVWRDFFHRQPHWRIRPDLLNTVEQQQREQQLGPPKEDEDGEGMHPLDAMLATPTKPGRRTPAKYPRSARERPSAAAPSQATSPVKPNAFSNVVADLNSVHIASMAPVSHAPSHTFQTPPRRQQAPPSLQRSNSTPYHATDATTREVPSPYFIKPLKAPLKGLDWPKLYKTRYMLDQRWKNGQSDTVILRGHRDNIYCVCSDYDYIITGSRDPSIKIWDIKTGACKHTIEGMPASVLCLDYDGKELVFGSSDGCVYLFSMITWTQTRRLVGHIGGVLDVSLGTDYVVSSSKDCTIRIWSRHTGAHLRSLNDLGGAVNALGIKGDQMISAGGDNCLKLWDLPTGRVIRTFEGHSRGLACFAWDGDRCVSGGNDRTIRIWDVNTGECLNVLEGHQELVRCLAFDDKANRIVSGSYDRTVRLWDADNGEPLVEYRGGHSSYVFGVTMDTSRIITCSHDKRVIILSYAGDLDVSPFA